MPRTRLGKSTSQGSLALKIKRHLQTLGMKLCHLSVKCLSALDGLQHTGFVARRIFFNKSVTDVAQWAELQISNGKAKGLSHV